MKLSGLFLGLLFSIFSNLFSEECHPFKSWFEIKQDGLPSSYFQVDTDCELLKISQKVQHGAIYTNEYRAYQNTIVSGFESFMIPKANGFMIHSQAKQDGVGAGQEKGTSNYAHLIEMTKDATGQWTLKMSGIMKIVNTDHPEKSQVGQYSLSYKIVVLEEEPSYSAALSPRSNAVLHALGL